MLYTEGYYIQYTIAGLSGVRVVPDLRIHSASSVRDVYGRRYRVGESDRDVLGRSRKWVLWLSWAAMLAAGVQQYGFGSVVPVLTEANGWTPAEAFWTLALWTVCQAGTAFPAAWLRDRGRVSVGTAVVTGAVLCAIGLATLGHASSLVAVFAGYSVIGGVGAGLIYTTCVGTVVGWFPDKVTTGVAFVSGAFAYGCVPFVLAAGFLLEIDNRASFFDVASIVVLVVAAGCGVTLRNPPKNWWPTHLEPRAWALDKARRNNRPALRQYLPTEALRSGAAVPMYLAVLLAAAVSLFDLAYLSAFATASGAGPVLVVAALSVLAGFTGGGRVLVGWISDRVGRRRTLRLMLVTGGFAQFVLLYGGEHRQAPALLIGAGLAGLGTGCCYSLAVGLVGEYFGDDHVLQNFGLLYSAKAVGGLLGVGLAALVVLPGGYVAAFAVAGVLAMSAAVLTRALTQPGLPKLLLPGALPRGVLR
jgi:MFS family permease